MVPRRLALVLVGLLLLSPSLSLAALIEIHGANGVTGSPGADGPPAVDGGVGGDGEGVIQSIIGPLVLDATVVYGGNGGDGGSSPSLPTGTVPLAGGDGGAGGDATMTSTDPGGSTMWGRAQSYGGVGGNGGTPSAGSALRPAGTPGDGGRGGDASAEATTTHGGGAFFTTIAGAYATGGNGGNGAVASDGTAGRGGDGGNAHAAAQSIEGMDPNTYAFVQAWGGNGGNGGIGGNGGTVDLGPIFASSLTNQWAEADVDARAGNGGAAIVAGGQNGAGGDLSLHNAVSAQSTHYVLLSQEVHGGQAGSDPLHPTAGAADGGDASSSMDQAVSTDLYELNLRSYAGNGSRGSAGAGLGGNAHNEADLSNDAGAIFVKSIAAAGGGGGVGAGGNATNLLHATTTGDGHWISLGLDPSYGSYAGTFGGQADPNASVLAVGPGGRGGDADSASYGEALGVSDVNVADAATGGNGGGISGATPDRHDGGAGGDAASNATAVSSGNAYAASFATGGKGGAGAKDAAGGGASLGGNGGSAAGHAFARGALSATAAVTQIGGAGGDGPGGAGRGADSELVGAAYAESDGSVSMFEGATGGAGGAGAGSEGGDALAALTQMRDHGDLQLGATATGGAASFGGQGGDGRVNLSGLNSGAGSLAVTGVAQGGSTSYANGSGGNAILEQVDARSLGGGDASAYGTATGGNGLEGVSIDLDNAVTGETSGHLVLVQRAVGGAGIFDGGSAHSRLTHTGSSASIGVTAEAWAGSLQTYPPPPPILPCPYPPYQCPPPPAPVVPPLPPAPAGFPHPAVALAEAEAHNLTGAASADATAVGSSAGQSPDPLFDATVGGDAHAWSSAEGNGDGQPVHAGASAGGGLGATTPRVGTNGGAATAYSIGIAHGDSSVDVVAAATGGDSGFGAGAQGGVASAEAHAIGAGTSRVTAGANARGGSGGVFPSFEYRAPASAVATAFGLGQVRADAAADGRGLLTMSTRSESVGPVTSVAIERDSFVPPGANIYGPNAVTGFREDMPNYYVGPLTSLSNALPGADDTAQWLSGSPNVATRAASGRVLALGGVAGIYSSEHHVDDLHTFSLAPSVLAPGDVLSLGFLDWTSSGAGVDVLHVELDVNGSQVFDTTFGDFAAAAAALTDTLYDIPLAGVDLTHAIEIALRVDIGVGSDEGGLTTRFALIGPVVPEPSVLALVALAAVATLGGMMRRGLPDHPLRNRALAR